MAYWRAVGLSFHISTTGSGVAQVLCLQTSPGDQNLDTYFFLDLIRLMSSVYLQQHSFDELLQLRRCMAWEGVLQQVLLCGLEVLDRRKVFQDTRTNPMIKNHFLFGTTN